jgi:hypothetical protein
MKNSHEVLYDLEISRLQNQDKEKKWTELRREYCSPAVLGFTWLGVLCFMSLIATLQLRNHPGDWEGLPMLFAPVVMMAPGVIVAFQRKLRALLKIIEAEAPQLFQKLKTKGIA